MFTDALGRTTKVRTPDNAIARTSYSGNTVTVTDQAGKVRRSISDALGRLARVDEPDGSGNLGSVSSPLQPTNYGYDVLDDLLSVSQGVQTRTFVYDSLKRLTSATNPESGTVGYTYDNNGNLLTKTDSRNIVITMAYDVLNRPTSKSYANDGGITPTVAYFYDSQPLPTGAPTFDRGYSIGRLVAVAYGGGSAGNYAGFDALGRPLRKIQQTDSVNYLVEAAYSVSAMTSETYPSVPGYGDRRTVTYTPDAAGRLSSLNSNATTYSPAASVSSIGYASHNALNTESYGGTVHTISYNNRLQPTEIKLATVGKGSITLVDLVYNYGSTNNNGNVQSITYTGGGLNYTQSFGYDALNRLTTSVENNGASWSQTNGYDRYGNRWIDLGGGNQSLYFTATTNRITGWSYDASGNLLNDGVHNYTFDAENKISKVDNVTAYSYNGEGQRVKKLVGENTRFIYGIGGQLIAEFDGASGNLKKEYVYGGGGMITIEPNGKGSLGAQYATSDMLGSPRVVTNSSGSVVSRHDYMPFGEELFAGTGGRTTGMGFSVSDGNRQKFTGYERDSETGLDFAQARYNSSAQGRFTSPDSLFGLALNPQTLNRYAYVANNPLKFTDPTGHEMYSATTHGPERGMGVVNSTDRIFSEFMIPQSEAELDHAQRVQNTYDAADANDAQARGDLTTRDRIMEGNSSLEYEDDSSGSVTASAEITGVAGQEFCSLQGDGPYVLKNLPPDFGTSTGEIKGGPIGDGECMQLVQTALERQGTPLGEAGYGRLKRGAAVSETPNIKRGTLIASGWHPDGYYANYYPHGNHAAFFLQFTQKGFLVYEQVNKHLRVVEKFWGEGGYYRNANAYYIVLTGARVPGVPRKQKYSVY